MTCCVLIVIYYAVTLRRRDVGVADVNARHIVTYYTLPFSAAYKQCGVTVINHYHHQRNIMCNVIGVNILSSVNDNGGVAHVCVISVCLYENKRDISEA